MKTFNPFEMPEDQKKDCAIFRVKRANEAIGDVRGFYGSRDNRIQIVDQNEIARGDWVSDLADGREFFVLGVDQKKLDGHWTDTILIVQSSEGYAKSTREAAPSVSINVGTISGNNASIGNSGMEIRGNTFTSTASTVIDDLKRMAGSVPPDDLPEFFDLVRDLESVERGEKDASGALRPYRSLLDRLTDVGAFVAKLACKFMIL